MEVFDAIVIGGGVLGCFAARSLTRYDLKTALLEKSDDLCTGISRANTAIVYSGCDTKPGTLKTTMCVRAAQGFAALCDELGVRYSKCGSIMICFGERGAGVLMKKLRDGTANGVRGIRLLTRGEVLELEPNIAGNVHSGLYVPDTGTVMPWELCLAAADNAVKNGAEIFLNTEVTGINTSQGDAGSSVIRSVQTHFGDPNSGFRYEIQTDKGVFLARSVINCAGLAADKLLEMVSEPVVRIVPSAGEYFILDTTEIDLVKTVVFQCPSKLGKGVLVAPTVHGNIIVGPDSKYFSKDDYSTTVAGLDFVRNSALRCVPSVNFRASIRNFSGIRADAGINDFIIGESKETPGFFNVAGIKSPGLTSAPAIAKEIAKLLHAAGLSDEPNPDFVAKRRIMRFKELSEEEKSRAIRENPLYGTIVCRCETVTEGEIEDALNRPLPPRSVDALKRRCTPGMGRCQGGFCGPKVLSLIAKHFNIRPEDVPQDKKDMYIVTGETKRGCV